MDEVLQHRYVRQMKSLSPTLAFGIKFVLYFAILMGAFELSRGSAAERFLVEDCILEPAIGLIRTIAPNEQVELIGRTIQSPVSKLRVTRGCEGVEIFLILVAGVIAFPARWTARLHGLTVGAAIAYVLSLARLIALHFTLRYSPGAWEALHGLVLPLGPIVVISLYFMSWSGRVPMNQASHAA
jgi:exosortase/archaeosortase family protein